MIRTRRIYGLIYRIRTSSRARSRHRAAKSTGATIREPWRPTGSRHRGAEGFDRAEQAIATLDAAILQSDGGDRLATAGSARGRSAAGRPLSNHATARCRRATRRDRTRHAGEHRIGAGCTTRAFDRLMSGSAYLRVAGQTHLQTFADCLRLLDFGRLFISAIADLSGEIPFTMQEACFAGIVYPNLNRPDAKPPCSVHRARCRPRDV